MDDGTVSVRITNAQRVLKTVIDGHELIGVRSLEFGAGTDNLPHLRVDMLVFQPFEITVSAKVTINLVPMPGSQILDITSHDEPVGARRLMVTFPK